MGPDSRIVTRTGSCPPDVQILVPLSYFQQRVIWPSVAVVDVIHGHDIAISYKIVVCRFGLCCML